MEENKESPSIQPVQGSPPEQAIPTAPPVQGKPKLKLPILLAGVVLFLLLIGTASAVYLFVNKKSEPIACTMEAKICSDGSSVGRTGPKCEFTPCPTSKVDETSTWKTYINSKYKFSFRYPPDLYVRLESNDEYTTFLEKQNDNSSAKLSFGVVRNPQNTSIEEVFENNRPIPDDRKSVEYEKTFVNNYEASAIRTEMPCLGICEKSSVEKYYSVAIKGSGFIVSFQRETREPGGNTLEDKKWLDQILSTFKFTDSNPTPTCMERPACLDATPRCLMPEPATGWCP